MRTKLLALVLLANSWNNAAAAGSNNQTSDSPRRWSGVPQHYFMNRPFSDHERMETEKLYGTWRLIYEEDAGAKLPVKANETFAFEKRAWYPHGQCFLVNRVGDKVVDVLTVRICPFRRQNEMHLWQGKTCQWIPHMAIYKIEGNRLTICVVFTHEGTQPADFTTGVNNRNTLLILEKVEPKGK